MDNEKDLQVLSEGISFLKNSINGLEKSYFLKEESNITYYELRKLFAVLEKQTQDPVVLKVLKDISRILAKLEVRNVPIPTLKKSLARSRQVFKPTKEKK